MPLAVWLFSCYVVLFVLSNLDMNSADDCNKVTSKMFSTDDQTKYKAKSCIKLVAYL